MSQGNVYIMLNPSTHGYLKIGYTTRASEERARELSNNTGVVGKFVVAYDVHVANARALEGVVHKKLDRYRIDQNKEFFEVSLKKAIKTLEDSIAELDAQLPIQWNELSLLSKPDEWWAQLGIFWQQTLRKHLPLNFAPTQADLIEAVHQVIDYSQDEHLRGKIAKLIVSKNYQTTIAEWFGRLGASAQHELKSYTNYTPSSTDYATIAQLTTLDCWQNPRINDLHPARELVALTSLNCNNAQVQNLLPLAQLAQLQTLVLNFSEVSQLDALKKLKQLKHLSLNYCPIKTLTPLKSLQNLETLELMHTEVKSLKPLEKLPRLQLVKCAHTQISAADAQAFEQAKPGCKVVVGGGLF